MTYEQIVEKVRTAYERYADARDIFEHVAIQVNIEGEGHGAFYIEVAQRQICVEPYEYYDRDAVIVTTGDVIFEIADGKRVFHEAVNEGLVKVYGNLDKLALLGKIKFDKKKGKTTSKRLDS